MVEVAAAEVAGLPEAVVVEAVGPLVVVVATEVVAEEALPKSLKSLN